MVGNFGTGPQALVEQLMLELSAGVSLSKAALILGISADEALRIMQDHAMEVRLMNLERAWADALLKMPGNEDVGRDDGNVVTFPLRGRALN